MATVYSLALVCVICFARYTPSSGNSFHYVIMRTDLTVFIVCFVILFDTKLLQGILYFYLSVFKFFLCACLVYRCF